MNIECVDFSRVERMIAGLVGEPCMRKEVGEYKSLSLGFGPEEVPNKVPAARIYRTWELRTYRSSWRIVRGGFVICGHRDLGDNAEFNITLGSIDLGKFASLRQLNDLDIRIELDNGVKVDFLSTFSDDDELISIFCPGNSIIEYSVRHGWITGPSDKPWIRSTHDCVDNPDLDQNMK